MSVSRESSIASPLSRLALAVAVALALVAGGRVVSKQWLALSSAHLRAPGVDAQSVARAREMLSELAGTNILELDVPGLRRRLESLPGVGEASVRRRPRELLAELRPRKPLARWADGGLVSARGRRYPGSASSWLPLFSGAESETAAMAEFYGSARMILARRGLAVAQLELSASGDWRVVLQNGVALYLGRESPRSRLRRFAEYYPALESRYARMDSADLRYARAIAVRGERVSGESGTDGEVSGTESRPESRNESRNGFGTGEDSVRGGGGGVKVFENEAGARVGIVDDVVGGGSEVGSGVGFGLQLAGSDSRSEDAQ